MAGCASDATLLAPPQAGRELWRCTQEMVTSKHAVEASRTCHPQKAWFHTTAAACSANSLHWRICRNTGTSPWVQLQVKWLHASGGRVQGKRGVCLIRTWQALRAGAAMGRTQLKRCTSNDRVQTKW